MRSLHPPRETQMGLPNEIRFCKSVIVALGILGGFPSIAHAHLVTTGLGPVYDGIGHFLLTPQDIIAVLALSLWAGLNGTSHCRTVLFLLPLAWLAAGLTAMTWLQSWGSFPFSAISFVVLGLLVAANVRVTRGWVSLVSVLLGVVHGLDNGIALRENAGMLGLIGIAMTLFVVVSLATAFVVSLEKPWMKIVVRVAGSWIVATGIMMLGWHFRPASEIEPIKTATVLSVLDLRFEATTARSKYHSFAHKDSLPAKSGRGAFILNQHGLWPRPESKRPEPIDGQDVMKPIAGRFATQELIEVSNFNLGTVWPIQPFSKTKKQSVL